MSALDSFITQCQEEMKRNTFFLDLPGSRDRAKNLEGIICMSMCSDHGNCIQGKRSVSKVRGWVTGVRGLSVRGGDG